ncbi:hypothetical protein ACSDR0_49380 [Streptosporangium sp. G11]|uniref:hypothetical protein n=1 Tax=Streptosporangium sp. G11 TaxID=3436926 RepID=UPI003EC02FBD
MSSVTAKRTRVTALVVLVIALLFGLLYLTMRAWGGKPLEVDPRAVRQVQEIGQVSASAKATSTESDSVVTTEYMIFDLVVPDQRDALKKGVELLQSRGWEVDTDRSPKAVHMKSSQRKDVLLSLEPLKEYEEYISNGTLDEKVTRAIKQVQVKAKYPNSLIIVDMRPFGP